MRNAPASPSPPPAAAHACFYSRIAEILCNNLTQNTSDNFHFVISAFPFNSTADSSSPSLGKSPRSEVVRELAAAATLWRSRWSELDLLDLRPRTNSRSRGIGPEATQRWEGGRNEHSCKRKLLSRRTNATRIQSLDLREDYPRRSTSSNIATWICKWQMRVA